MPKNVPFAKQRGRRFGLTEKLRSMKRKSPAFFYPVDAGKSPAAPHVVAKRLGIKVSIEVAKVGSRTGVMVKRVA